jgi:hypothetical protein
MATIKFTDRYLTFQRAKYFNPPVQGSCLVRPIENQPALSLTKGPRFTRSASRHPRPVHAAFQVVQQVVARPSVLGLR